jgi:hypothetical protein
MNFGGHSDIESIFKGRKYEEIYFEGGPEFCTRLLMSPWEFGTPLLSQRKYSSNFGASWSYL